MIAQGQPGHMVITVSVSGLFETPTHQNGAYGATKMALGLARTPDDVGTIAVRAITDDAFLVTTHPVGARELYLDRHHSILAAFDRCEETISQPGISPAMRAMP